MKYVRRLMWFIASRMLAATLLISILVCAFYMCMDSANIYVVVADTRSVLEPRLLGKHLGLDPLATLAALYVGYKLWGILGMILSPLLAVTALQLFPEAAE